MRNVPVVARPCAAAGRTRGRASRACIASAITSISGARTIKPQSANTRSTMRLSSFDERERSSGGRPISGMPSTVCTPTFGPTTSNRRGTMSTCTSYSLSSRISRSMSIVRVVRERDHDALDVEQLDEPREVVELAKQRDVLDADLRLARRGVDEPDDVDAVLPVLEHLLRDQLADVAGADDDRVLQVLDLPPAVAARQRTHDHDREDRCGPEEHQLRHRHAADVGHLHAHEQEPGAERDQVEDRDELVDGRMVGALLVAVVEAVHLRHERPRPGARRGRAPCRAPSRAALPARRAIAR